MAGRSAKARLALMGARRVRASSSRWSRTGPVAAARRVGAKGNGNASKAAASQTAMAWAATEHERDAAALKKAGVEFVEADLPGLPQLADIYMALGHYERPRDLAIYLASHGAKRTILDVYDAAVSPAMRTTRQRLMEGEKTSSAAYRHIIEVEQPKLRQAYASYFETHRVTAMFTPASPVTAKTVGDDGNVMVNGTSESALAYARYTLPPTTAQLPGLSVPLALTPSGMPMGGLFIGPSMSDDALLGLGPAFGKVFPPLPAPKLDI